MSKYEAFIFCDTIGQGKEKDMEQKQSTEFPEDVHRMEEKNAPDECEKYYENVDTNDVYDEESDEKLREVVNAGLHEMEAMINSMKNAADDMKKTVEERIWWPIKISENADEDGENMRQKSRKDDECILNGIEERIKNAEKDISKSIEPSIIEKMAESTKEKISSAAEFVKKVVQ